MKCLIVAVLLPLSLAFGCTAEGGSSGTADSASVADTPNNSSSDSATVIDTVATVDGGEPKVDSSTATDVASSEINPEPEIDVAVDTAPEEPEGLPPGVQGKEPPGETALPQFAAVVDQNGDKVGPERLVGPWTVIWFYPKASTGG